ncbi:unannotated protein [freshwater metagenome]|uniref:Unannotated protein n=1 Tax=freshwater metagenome TaxID=449393 RepID=A0A6J7I4S1_9ZZZZ
MTLSEGITWSMVRARPTGQPLVSIDAIVELSGSSRSLVIIGRSSTSIFAAVSSLMACFTGSFSKLIAPMARPWNQSWSTAADRCPTPRTAPRLSTLIGSK